MFGVLKVKFRVKSYVAIIIDIYFIDRIEPCSSWLKVIPNFVVTRLSNKFFQC